MTSLTKEHLMMLKLMAHRAGKGRVSYGSVFYQGEMARVLEISSKDASYYIKKWLKGNLILKNKLLYTENMLMQHQDLLRHGRLGLIGFMGLLHSEPPKPESQSKQYTCLLCDLQSQELRWDDDFIPRLFEHHAKRKHSESVRDLERLAGRHLSEKDAMVYWYNLYVQVEAVGTVSRPVQWYAFNQEWWLELNRVINPVVLSNLDQGTEQELARILRELDNAYAVERPVFSRLMRYVATILESKPGLGKDLANIQRILKLIREGRTADPAAMYGLDLPPLNIP